MQVFEGQKVDLVSPFPVQELPRLRKWMFCYKSLILDDSIANSEEALLEYLEQYIHQPNVVTWGVIDKHNITGYVHEAPLIGYVSFEQLSPYNGYLHVASARVAWGKSLIDDAVATILPYLFLPEIGLLRVSCAILAKNAAAKQLAYRMGFSRDGRFESLVLQNGQPQDVLHFGLTRKAFEEQQASTETTPLPLNESPTQQETTNERQST